MLLARRCAHHTAGHRGILGSSVSCSTEGTGVASVGYRESQWERQRELGQQWGNTTWMVGELQGMPVLGHGAYWQQGAKRGAAQRVFM